MIEKWRKKPHQCHAGTDVAPQRSGGVNFHSIVCHVGGPDNVHESRKALLQWWSCPHNHSHGEVSDPQIFNLSPSETVDESVVK